MDCLLGIIRKPNGLMVLGNRVKYQLDPNADILHIMDIALGTSLYEIVELPLELLEPSPKGSSTLRLPFLKKDQLIASWNYLSCVDELNAETLFHVLVILLETLSDPLESALMLPNLLVDSSTQAIKPTATHPRAYKGTKYKPPKSKEFPKVDLRLYLCDIKHQNQLLLRLSQHWDEALEKLNKMGYDTRALSSIPTKNLILDPYYTLHHNLHVAVDYPSLPIPFHRYLLPSLKGLNWVDITDYLSVYWGLRLDSQLNLLLAISHLINLKNDSNTLRWCQIIAQQPESHRLIFTIILISTQAYYLNTSKKLIEDIERFNHLTDEIDYAYRLYCLVLGLKKGIYADYILAGFKLASKYQPDYHRFHYLDGNSLFPDEVVEKLVYIGDAMQWNERKFLNVWEQCGKLKGLINILLQIDWMHYEKDIAEKYLDFYLYIIDLYPETEKEAELSQAKWKFIRGQVNIIDTLLRGVERGYQNKAIDDLECYYWYWDKINELNLYIPSTHKIVQRLAQPPFSQKSHAAKVIISFISYLDAEQRSVFINAPDASFLHLEQACGLNNYTQLITGGIRAITKYLSDFSQQCFVYFPNKLFKVAKLLGSLNIPISFIVVQTFNQHPIMTEDITKLSLKETYEFIEKQCGNQFSNSIPRKMRRYVQGQRSLNEHQISSSLELIRKQIQFTRLEVLESLTLNALKRDFDVEPKQENIKHALSILGTIDDNSRSLRKFLKAYWGNESDYLFNHSLTQTWLKKHNHLNIDLWMTGIEYSSIINEFGTIEIKLEKEPLEVLKLGTYVGSCLGLGGICSYSAAAVLLDINKQVLYARNQKGTVVARQLVAISEEEELVCFHIYPDGVNESIKKIFYEYDVGFADALGLKLYHTNEDDEYIIENIISQSWWNDDAWDFIS
jgi:hypothetical protein